jgi:hypothetical protein
LSSGSLEGQEGLALNEHFLLGLLARNNGSNLNFGAVAASEGSNEVRGSFLTKDDKYGTFVTTL